MTRISGCGHRGNGIDRPEQTLAAYRRALDLGASMIEFDVRLTSDDRLVVIHDATLERTTNGSGPVISHTADEIRTLDAGAWFAAEFAGERVPLLEEVCTLLGRAGALGCVEVKAETAEHAERTALLLADWLLVNDQEARLRMSSFHLDALESVARRAPSIPLLPWMDEFSPADVPGHLADARRLHALGVFHTASLLHRSQVADMQDAGLEVWVWSADDEAALRQAVELGPDVISCSNIATLMSAIEEGDR